MATKQKHIDQLFRDAAQQYAAPTPDAAWGRLESSLKKKRKKRFIWWWIFGAGFLVMLGSLLYFSSFELELAPKQAAEKPQNLSLPADSKSVEPLPEQEAATALDTSAERTSSEKPQEVLRENLSHVPAEKEQQQRKLPASNAKVIQNNKKRLVKKQLRDINLKAEVDTAKKIIQIHQEDTSSNIKETLAYEEKFADSLNPQVETVLLDSLQDIVNQEDTLQKDSLITSVEPETEKPEEKRSWNFYASYFLGFGQSSGIYSDPQVSSDFISRTHELKGKFEWGSQFSMGFMWKDWTIQLGLRNFDMHLEGDYEMKPGYLKYIPLENFGLSPLGYYDLGDIDYIMESKSYGNLTYLNRFTKTRFHIEMTTLSLEFGRQFYWKKWSVMPLLGIQQMTIEKAFVEVAEDAHFTDFGKLNNIKERLTGLMAGIHLIYPLSEKLYIGLHADASLSLNNISKTEGIRFLPFAYYLGPKMMVKF